MKLFFKLFLFIFSIFILFYSDVLSVEYTCEYDFGGGTIYQLQFNTESGTIKILNQQKNVDLGTMYQYYHYSSFQLDGEVEVYNENECPVIYLLSTTVNYGVDSNNYDFYFKFYTDPYLRELGAIDCITTRDEVCLENFFGTFEFFEEGVLSNSDINKDKTLVSICPFYNILDSSLNKEIEKYNNCSNSTCYIEVSSQIQNIIDQMNKYCITVLSYRNYSYKDGSGNLNPDQCVKNCLSYNDSVEEKLPDKFKNSKITCGFTDRLLAIINNVLRWIKYILPAIVIILGIIDFIKAIASDKEDEMKKAQHKFIIRLISAALVFIVPFIIVFILDKMGFTPDSCGIDLFK